MLSHDDAEAIRRGKRLRPPNPSVSAASTIASAVQDRHINIIKYAVLGMTICFVALFVALFHQESVEWSVKAAEWAKGTGVVGMVVFAAIDALFVSSMLPGFVFTLLAGAVWGLWLGMLIAVSGKWVGAMISFFIGRWFCTPCAGAIRALPRGDQIMRAIGNSGWKICLLLRLSPLVPYNILNFAFAASDITWFDYTWTSFVGMLPGTFGLVYVGHLAGSVSASVHENEEWNLTHIMMLLGGATVTAVLLYVVNIIIRMEMNKVLHEPELPTSTYTVASRNTNTGSHDSVE